MEQHGKGPLAGFLPVEAQPINWAYPQGFFADPLRVAL